MFLTWQDHFKRCNVKFSYFLCHMTPRNMWLPHSTDELQMLVFCVFVSSAPCFLCPMLPLPYASSASNFLCPTLPLRLCPTLPLRLCIALPLPHTSSEALPHVFSTSHFLCLTLLLPHTFSASHFLAQGKHQQFRVPNIVLYIVIIWYVICAFLLEFTIIYYSLQWCKTHVKVEKNHSSVRVGQQMKIEVTAIYIGFQNSRGKSPAPWSLRHWVKILTYDKDFV